MKYLIIIFFVFIFNKNCILISALGMDNYLFLMSIKKCLKDSDRLMKEISKISI